MKEYDEYIHMRILEKEVGILSSRFKEHDTGHLRTAVGVLIARLDELEQSIMEKVNNGV